MKRFVFLVICIAVGASLSVCASYREAYFNDMWNESGERETDGYEFSTPLSPGNSVSDPFADPFENDGTSGYDEEFP